MALSLRYGHGDLGWFDNLPRSDRALIVAWDRLFGGGNG
jgi:hypothetical protein